jgi:hypothetical protein
MPFIFKPYIMGCSTQGCQEEIASYLLINKGYRLLDSMMIPHIERSYIFLKQLFNTKHNKGKVVVDNAFDILKKVFYKLQNKIHLHVIIISYLVVCCILHMLFLCDDRCLKHYTLF